MSFYWYSFTWGIHRSCTTTFSPREQRWTPVASSQPALSSVDGSAWMRCFATWVSAPGTRCRSLLELPWKSCRNRHWIYVRATAFLLLSKGKQHDFVSRHVANSPGFYFCLAVVSPFQFQTEQKQPGIAGTASARKELAFFFFCFLLVINTETNSKPRNFPFPPTAPLCVIYCQRWLCHFFAVLLLLLLLFYLVWYVSFLTRCGMCRILWVTKLSLFFLSLLGSCLSVCCGRVINKLSTYVLAIILRRFACQ